MIVSVGSRGVVEGAQVWPSLLDTHCVAGALSREPHPQRAGIGGGPVKSSHSSRFAEQVLLVRVQSP
jgi:hypothetical protein